jgi:hypothetical protein
MKFPFTTEEFYQVFVAYNTTVFPIQIFLNLLALTVILYAVRRKSFSDLFISFILSFLWLWIGVIYNLIFFSKINPAANIFAVLFIIQGLLFIYAGVIKNKLSFQFRKNCIGITGTILILYALIIYPLLGILFGHTYPANPTFGLPCPTTIFTFGMLLWSSKKIPVYIIILPFIWSLMGFSAAINLGVYEDFGLLAAGVVSVVLILVSNNRFNKEVQLQ